MPELHPPAESPGKRRRRFAQFSVRTLLIVVTLLGVWLGFHTNSANRQRRAVSALMESGVSVRFDCERLADSDGTVKYSSYSVDPALPTMLHRLLGEDFFRTAESVTSHYASIKDDVPRQIAQLADLESISLTHGQVGDNGLRYFAHLRRLNSLSLPRNGITDAGMAHLARLTQLEYLNLSGNQVSDAGLIHLKNLKKLRSLYLGNMPIGDAGLAHISSLPELELLHLARTRVTDAGLLHLASLKNLRRVTLSYTKVTKKAVERLQRELPACSFH